jgi:hypothetical protein
VALVDLCWTLEMLWKCFVSNSKLYQKALSVHLMYFKTNLEDIHFALGIT